jgi:lysophospholipase L1-like esterase
LAFFLCFRDRRLRRERFDSIRNLRSAGETIICFGDSLTEGVGAGSGEDYPSILSRLLVMPVINAGQRGDTTAEALARACPMRC